ncbi:MAG: anaerobic sulfatase maturase [Verrucomicrobiota bacterium]
MPQRVGFHVMTKPIGPICNLDCEYCYYLEKENLYAKNENFRMSDEVLESYVRQYIENQPGPEVSFAWQGGEPTLLGVGYFRRVVELQQKYANGKRIVNALQTNGTRLDDEWGEFFAKNGFLIGLSVDGPAHLHDTYRVDKKQRPTFDLVMRGRDFLVKHGAEFNTLTVVNAANSRRPLEVYRFLKEIGSGFMQFIPLVERVPSPDEAEHQLDFAEPPVPGAKRKRLPVTEWSVQPRTYGRFLVEIFHEWVRQDIGDYFVQIFDVSLGIWTGHGASLCVFMEECGSALALEHNGDLYSCDHYVYPRYKLGNLVDTPLGEMVNAPEQWEFGRSKKSTLPRYCRECDVRFACNGECPKHRFMRTPDGEDGLNYLCPAYKYFFRTVDPYMRVMGQLLQRRQPPAAIKDLLKEPGAAERFRIARPKDPCPCGSGKKFKNCCGTPLG